MTKSPTYLLVGDGRLARHLCEYSRLLDIEMTRWSRRERTGPAGCLKDATHVLLAISDEGVAEFHAQWRKTTGEATYWVHFSGARHFPGIVGAHPLMTFGPSLYNLSEYNRVPFILEHGGPPLESILPGFPNPSYEVPADKKALYHAWAVLATNAVSGTWREYRRIAGDEFGLPEVALTPFLEKTAENALTLDAPLTGPIVRGDITTIESNLQALEGSAFLPLYRALVAAFGKECT